MSFCRGIGAIDDVSDAFRSMEDGQYVEEYNFRLGAFAGENLESQGLLRPCRRELSRLKRYRNL